ncbi:MAG TPA: 50S ribosomal protein L15 [Alphaproteobacteria bacterium]|nr:50S ribosomal protein L15 [Alphaproteobacteria bacterium]HNS43824.1 50S ribosomal protein L15 [Alphaproteobacteria bacterium]
MKLNELQPQEGAVKKRMRVGRGIGSGKGKTCGKGQKGQKSRTGVAINGFEGGQMPLYRRLPKTGFTNLFAKDLSTISLARLQDAIDAGKIDAKSPITSEMLQKAGVAAKAKDGVRLLGNGELKAKVTLKIAGATASAKAAVEKAGGSVEIIVREVKPVVRKKPIPGRQ